jgi:hypothetical protein
MGFVGSAAMKPHPQNKASIIPGRGSGIRRHRNGHFFPAHSGQCPKLGEQFHGMSGLSALLLAV